MSPSALAPHVFGVRHLSPGGAWHLRRFLDRVQPTCVLVEGPADAGALIEDLLDARTVPPVAILAYTEDLPVRTLVYPLADYSPELQALRWAQEHGAEAQFCDLPSRVFLGLLRAADQRALERQRLAAKTAAEAAEAADAAAGAGDDAAEAGDDAAIEASDDQADDDAAIEAGDDEAGCVSSEDALARLEPRLSSYERLAERAGEETYEAFWERRFEHNCAPDSYRRAALELGRGLREIEEETGRPDLAENLVREAHMRRVLADAIARGHAPERIVVVCGAFHAPVIGLEQPAMSDAELASLPSAPCQLTLMPYSFFRLSSMSGYGAGNEAPAYFELFWQHLREDDLEGLPAEYLSRVVRELRAAGTHRSTAEVIEGVRLATALSALKGGQAPVLSDLRSAALTLIGHGSLGTIAEPLARVDVGTEVGSLPPGVAQTSIQEDFALQLERLRLGKYRKPVKEDLALDLRENRHARQAAAAFLDLERSYFLHRLRILEVGFGTLVDLGAQAATYKEHWHLVWAPESEIELVECVLLGETVELAVAYRLQRRLDDCQGIQEAARLVREAIWCGMPELTLSARRTLQALAVDSSDLAAAAGALGELAGLVRYGDVRRFEPGPFLPLIGDLFVQASLQLVSSARCDQAQAQRLLGALDVVNRVGLEQSERVDEALWLKALQELADRDDVSPLLSGYACAILLERSLLSSAELAKEVSRRLSPGIDADLGAGWFEGLAQRNRYGLISRLPLWAELADYVSSLEDEEFRRALVFLRRAFGAFGRTEKRQIAENLAEIWGVSQDALAEAIETPLSASEAQSLAELEDFDFGDL